MTTLENDTDAPGAVRDKFDDCAGRLLAPDKATALGDAVEALEAVDDVRALTSIIANAGSSEEAGTPVSFSTAVT